MQEPFHVNFIPWEHFLARFWTNPVWSPCSFPTHQFAKFQ